MIKILLSAVGKHDPIGEGKIDGPVITAVEELQPDIIFIFPTRKQVNKYISSTEDNSKDLTNLIKTRYPNVKIYERPLNLPDPTNYKDIIRLLTEELIEIQHQFSRSIVEYMISISSGTPQIQSSFLVLVSSNRIKAKIYQVVDPKYLEDKKAMVRPVEIHFMEENNQIQRAREYFQRYNFDASANEMANLALSTVYPERQQKAETYLDLLTSYFYWDMYQHDEAVKHLKKSLEAITRFGMEPLAIVLRKQLQTLNKIIEAGEHEAFVNLADLYYNSERRLVCKQYVDCLNRFKRIYEGAYYYLGAKQFNIKPREKIDRQPLKVRQTIGRQGNQYISLHDIGRIYESETGDKIIPVDLENRLNEFAEKRNNTINNHGMQSVDRKQASQALDLCAKLMNRVFPEDDLNNYCFSCQKLGEIEELIFNDL